MVPEKAFRPLAAITKTWQPGGPSNEGVAEDGAAAAERLLRANEALFTDPAFDNEEWFKRHFVPSVAAPPAEQGSAGPICRDCGAVVVEGSRTGKDVCRCPDTPACSGPAAVAKEEEAECLFQCRPEVCPPGRCRTKELEKGN